MKKDICFCDLPIRTQQLILDSYGASEPAELGYDIRPYTTIIIEDTAMVRTA